MLYKTFYNIKPSVVKRVTSPVKKCLKLFDLTAEVVYRQALLQNATTGDELTHLHLLFNPPYHTLLWCLLSWPTFLPPSPDWEPHLPRVHITPQTKEILISSPSRRTTPTLCRRPAGLLYSCRTACWCFLPRGRRQFHRVYERNPSPGARFPKDWKHHRHHWRDQWLSLHLYVT
jgi:hypothetical protein